MSFLYILLVFLFSFFSIFNFAGNNNSNKDTERKNDINIIFSELEKHYSLYGEYPTIDELTLNYDEKLPGLDREALIDPNGKKIQEGDYSYEPKNCSAIGCSSYYLTATLSNQEIYSKKSLN